ncbi:MAG: CDP-alcohol phosphatidyltransferase family protein [Candidatus Omnitrophota bacterium]
MTRPTLAELKQKCFKQSIDPSLKERYTRSWAVYYALYVTHFFSIRIVRWLFPTPVRPNHVTYLSFLAGIAAAFCFSLSSKWGLLAGAFCFEFFYILDAVDGQLARAKGMKSVGGAFLDDWGTFIVPPLVVFSLGMSPFARPQNPWMAFLAAMTVLAIPVIELIKLKFSHAHAVASAGPQAPASSRSLKKLFKGIYSLLYRSCTMPVVMNLVSVATILTLLDLGFSGGSCYGILVFYYGTVGTGIWFLKGVYSAETAR